MSFHAPEDNRILTGEFGTDHLYGNNGAFLFILNGKGLRCIVSDGGGWEHVSVSLANRTPTWEEMCYIKNKFWDEEDQVVQFHPPKSEYVNNHSFCLHLWRQSNGQKMPSPPSWMVGNKSKGTMI